MFRNLCTEDMLGTELLGNWTSLLCVFEKGHQDLCFLPSRVILSKQSFDDSSLLIL